MKLWHHQVDELIDLALNEDLCLGDITTDALVPPQIQGQASILVKGDGVLAGIEIAARVFQRVDPSLKVAILKQDGSRVKQRDIVLRIEGSLASILKAERTALNFASHLSGIATETARIVEAAAGSKALVLDTRKTLPGLRLLQKYAVRVGGGRNHRFNLGDGVLIKDNHLQALALEGEGLKEAVARARRYVSHTVKIQVEVETVEQALEALEAGADSILLDNMPPEEMRQVVDRVKGRIPLEASGGVRPENARAIAASGVDLMSSGYITHSVKALDLSLDVEAIKP